MATRSARISDTNSATSVVREAFAGGGTGGGPPSLMSSGGTIRPADIRVMRSAGLGVGGQSPEQNGGAPCVLPSVAFPHCGVAEGGA